MTLQFDNREQKVKSQRVLLILILVFFLVTRLYKISEIPPSVYWDEASIGYNAYSISQTLKDEWGEFLPLHFRAFGEFKLPVYIYSVVPFVQIFGLNELSVRIPSVLFSLGVVILTYLLARRFSGSAVVGLFGSLFVSISPWFFIFSRTGFEATAGLAFYLLGIYIFLNYTKIGYAIFFSILFFILSAYSYNSFRIVSPLTVLVLIFLAKENLIDMLKRQLGWIILSLVVISISIVPIYRLYAYDVGLFRLQAVGAVNREMFFKNYISHFNPYLLFIQGDNNLRHQQRGFGQLYIPELLLIILGVVFLFKVRTEYRWLPILLILLAPIPASLTRESPHALRSLSAVPFIHIISAMGVFYMGKFFKKNIIFLAIFAIFISFFINYFINFLDVYPMQSLKSWQYGYKKIFTDISLSFNEKERVLIPEEDGQPYIFALFYLKYDPQKFRSEVVRNPVEKWGFSTVKKFGRFEFGNKDE